MAITTKRPPSTGPERPSRHWLRRTLIGLAIGIPVAVVVAVVLALRSTAPPSFPSLAATPDASLAGTVAYVRSTAKAGWCVTVVAAAGAPSKDVLCSAGGEAETGPPRMPSIAWRSDGRLEVTDTVGGPLAPGQPPEAPQAGPPAWRKLIDPRTGTVQPLPPGQAPIPFPPSSNSATLGNQTVTVSLHDGRATLTLTGPSGTRTLMWKGFQYEFSRPMWSPDGKWILVYDSAARLLLVTVDDPSRARLLVPKDVSDNLHVAITGADILG